MVVHSAYPFDETRVQRQADHLVSTGWQVDVVCLRQDREPATERVDGVTVRRVPVRRNRQRGGIGQLAEYLAFAGLAFLLLALRRLRGRYDVVHVHNLPDFLVFSALVPRLSGSRIVLDLHDLMPEFAQSRFGSAPSGAMVRALLVQERLATRFAHEVITVTEDWRQTLAARSVPLDKVSVVRNLPDERFFHLAVEPERPSADAPVALRLVYHGTVAERSGLQLVIEAMARIRETTPTSLLIVGRGPYLDEVLATAATAGVAARVDARTELVPVEQLARLVKGADCAIVPYLSDPFTDGILPTKVLECAALGVPVIAASTSAMRAAFTDDEVALFPAGDAGALAALLEDLGAHLDRLETYRAHLMAWAARNRWVDEARRLDQVAAG